MNITATTVQNRLWELKQIGSEVRDMTRVSVQLQWRTRDVQRQSRGVGLLAATQRENTAISPSCSPSYNTPPIPPAPHHTVRWSCLTWKPPPDVFCQWTVSTAHRLKTSFLFACASTATADLMGRCWQLRGGRNRPEGGLAISWRSKIKKPGAHFRLDILFLDQRYLLPHISLLVTVTHFCSTTRPNTVSASSKAWNDLCCHVGLCQCKYLSRMRQRKQWHLLVQKGLV